MVVSLSCSREAEVWTEQPEDCVHFFNIGELCIKCSLTPSAAHLVINPSRLLVVHRLVFFT